jgi:protocatechuate 3,4-dioxygenase beta subunit
MNLLDTPAPSPLEDLDDDDRLIGRILSRREVLALIGAGGVAVGIAACVPGGSGSTATAGASAGPTSTATAGASATASAAASADATAAGALPSCVVAPELTEGPYYVDVNLERSDIRPNTSDGVAAEGTPLKLGWLVSQVDGDGCLPLEGAIVDVWHCDALGVYSGVQGSSGTDFLRGFQRTDASGAAAFTTVYPGWYQGRAVHIHFKIRTDPDAEAGFEFTSQLFFDDALSQQVYSSGVYASKGQPDQLNASDSIYNQSGGATLLDVTQDGDGYKTTFQVAVQLA